MSHIIKSLGLSIIMFTSSLAIPVAIGFSPVATTSAATIKLNKSTKTLYVGQTYQLKVSGTKRKVYWSSSKKSVATVSSGKVRAKKKGTAYIYAKVAGKKLKCKITVKAVSSGTDTTSTPTVDNDD